MAVIDIVALSSADARYGGQQIKKAKHNPHNDMLKGVKVYACVLDGQIMGCDSMSHAMDCYNANVDDCKEAYIIEAVAKRKIWKQDVEETQWESEVIQ